ncbi:Macrolide-specific efflux protein MacA [Arcticibacter svalbardensis MN12-7]|uniref:Macrolide-specific efflux protein MacA n=1 Tax=Arcticibacter svalbardensis MN12-7 TaxID=1150600 RepID=R9H1M4_9SPHI|nr:efflux RND transporter periplasmic adaptor subunit [Arcticibacter svalbardensis]EOR95109.1 Macrolide-specific efflux protein MacA [Arcticibacter svalbardensis MN12-7]
MEQKKKKKSTLKFVIIGVVLLIVVLGIAFKMGWIGSGNKTMVATEKVQKRNITETVSASGKVQAEIEVKLSSEVSGEIVELEVKEGDVVKKGQLLCKIRPDILQSGYNRAVASLNTQRASLAGAQQQLLQAEATFRNTQASYKRSVELYKQKVLSAAENDVALAEYQSAKANLEALKQNIIGSKYGVEQSQAVVKEAADNLDRTIIYAPVDGVVSKLSVELGERVVGTAQMAGTEIMRISNLNSMEVNVNVNENDINRVAIGNLADIEVDAFQEKKFQGKVTEIASSANIVGESTDQVTNFSVKIRILPESYASYMKNRDKEKSPFLPGLSATVDIQTKKASGIAVPIQSVTTREDLNMNVNKAPKKDKDKPDVKEYVFVYKNGLVRQIAVTTGIQNDTYIQVLSGLKENEEIVSAPFSAISKTLKDSLVVEKVGKDKLFEGEAKK